MAARGRKAVVIELSEEERETLGRWVRRRSTAQSLALRSRIVLGAAEGRTNADIAAELGCHAATVGKWRNRFARCRLDGLSDEPRPGAPRRIDDAKVEEVVGSGLWRRHLGTRRIGHTRSMAAAVGVSSTTVHRIWRAFGLQPHRTENVQGVTRPPVRGEGTRYRGLIPEPARAGGGALRGRKNPECRRWTAPAPILPILPAHPSGAPTTTNVTEPPTSPPRSTTPPAK